MPKPKVLSGADVVRILASFGFGVASQRGSHIKLRRMTSDGTRQHSPYRITASWTEELCLEFIGRRFATFPARNLHSIFTQTECAKLFFAAAHRALLPERGTSGSVQRGPANPARPGREQRYRDCLGCRRSPEVPRAENAVHNRRLESKVSCEALALTVQQ